MDVCLSFSLYKRQKLTQLLTANTLYEESSIEDWLRWKAQELAVTEPLLVLDILKFKAVKRGQKQKLVILMVYGSLDLTSLYGQQFETTHVLPLIHF